MRQVAITGRLIQRINQRGGIGGIEAMPLAAMMRAEEASMKLEEAGKKRSEADGSSRTTILQALNILIEPGQVVELRALVLWREEALAIQPVVLRPHGGYAAHEFDARRIEPSLHLTEGLFGLVRVAVLIGIPCAALAGAQAPLTEHRINPFHTPTRQAEYLPAEIRCQPPVRVV